MTLRSTLNCLLLCYGIAINPGILAQNNGPGGLYTTKSKSSLTLWINAPQQAIEYKLAHGAFISKVLDYSFNANHLEYGTGVQVYNHRNGHKALGFTGTRYLEGLPTSAISSSQGCTILTVFEPLVPNGSGQMVVSYLDESAGVRKGFANYLRTATEFWSGDGSALGSKSYLGQNVPGGSNLSFRINSAIISNTRQAMYMNLEFSRNFVNGVYSSPVDTRFRIGADNRIPAGANFYVGYLLEVIVFNKVLTEVEHVIVNNYLAAKYGLTLTIRDFYTWDKTTKGNFDYDVAGLGNIPGSSWEKSQGTGIIRMEGRGASGNYLFWGHNNASMNPVITDLPAGIAAKLGRTWGVNAVKANLSEGTPAEFGWVNLIINLSEFKYGDIFPSDLRILVDHDGDRVYNETGTQIIGNAIPMGNNEYLFQVKFPAGASTFTLGTINAATTPLPIVLKDFQVHLRNNQVEVSWTTLAEVNTSHFEVQRSTDAITWDTLGEIPAAGNSTTPKSYQYIDRVAPKGRLYYRMIQYDQDGTHVVYAPVRIDFVPQINSPYPNPIRTGDLLYLPDSEFGNPWELYSPSGTKITAETTPLTLRIPDNLDPGVYLLQSRGSLRKSFKVVIVP